MIYELLFTGSGTEMFHSRFLSDYTTQELKISRDVIKLVKLRF